MSPRTAIASVIAAAIAPLALVAPAHAAADWNPDHLMVKATPDSSQWWAANDLGLDGLSDAQPGEIIDLKWDLCTHRGPDHGQGDCLSVDGSTWVPWRVAGPLLVPAGPDGDSGSVYPDYSTPMRYVHQAGSMSTTEAFNRDPNDPNAESVDQPDNLVWVSDQETTVNNPLAGGQKTWVRVGWGAHDAWVRAERLHPIKVANSETSQDEPGTGSENPAPTNTDSESDEHSSGDDTTMVDDSQAALQEEEEAVDAQPAVAETDERGIPRGLILAGGIGALGLAAGVVIRRKRREGDSVKRDDVEVL